MRHVQKKNTPSDSFTLEELNRPETCGPRNAALTLTLTLIRTLSYKKTLEIHPGATLALW